MGSSKRRQQRGLARREMLREQQRIAHVRRLAAIEITEQSSFRGPLPPPAMLAQYETLAPGTADRIITMAEDAMYHQQTLEAEEHTRAHRRDLAGMFLSFCMAIAMIGGSIALAMLGHGVWGIVGFFMTGGAMVARVTFGFIQRFRGTSDRQEEAQMTLKFGQKDGDTKTG